MSEFSGKRFFFAGNFGLFSKVQRNNALKAHGASTAKRLDNSVNFVVQGSSGNKLTEDQLEGKVVYDEMRFAKNVIFSANRMQRESATRVEESAEYAVKPLAVEINIGDLLKRIQDIEAGSIFTSLFIYPSSDKRAPIIRSLFSYLKMGGQIIFACRGLTDNSRGYPMTQYGLIDASRNVTVAAFESYGKKKSVGDHLYIAEGDGAGFYEAVESNRPLVVTASVLSGLAKLDDWQLKCYQIEKSDEEGYYRLSEQFYTKYKKSLQTNESWIASGFCKEVYQAATAVLQTGNGWVF